MARQKANSTTIKRGLKFAQLIREAREARGLSQGELASKAGVSIDTIRSIETNKIKAPSIFVAIDLVSALGEKWLTWIKHIEGV